MKFSCLKEKIEKALIIAERFSGKNLTLPILSNILLETYDNFIRITATNLEHAVQINIPGKVHREGKISVPAKIISSLVQSIKEDKIDLEEKQGNLLLSTENKDIKINGISGEDFPLIPAVKKQQGFKINGLNLRTAIEKVIPAVSISDFKPEFTGIFFKIINKELKIVATDTFRLAEYKLEIDNKNNNFSFIIPYQMMQELIRIISTDEEIKISYGENQVLFEIGDIKITSRIIEGLFPDYENIIPKNFENTSFIIKNQFKDSVKTSAIFTSKIMEVSLKIRNKQLEIKSGNQDVGEYKNIIAIHTSNPDNEMKVSFNYKYLLDGLNSLDEEEIFFGCNSENSPSLFHNKSDQYFLYILMPIKIS
ncbi:MAG: DNA polymerase III subunit beta [Patescibacteria group bacterium]